MTFGDLKAHLLVTHLKEATHTPTRSPLNNALTMDYRDIFFQTTMIAKSGKRQIPIRMIQIERDGSQVLEKDSFRSIQSIGEQSLQ